MRSKKEMMDLIMTVAEKDDRIRAVLLVGSRANPNAPKDKYQDYDITYLVRDVSPFYNNPEWVERHFGKPAIMQMPEAMSLIPPENDGHFTYLIIFDDGNRIDLSFYCTPNIEEGEPAIVLLDKDGLLPQLPAPSDKLWHIKPPAEKQFANCCNEFWWCLNNVGKGIARDELPYAMKMFHEYVRNMLHIMLEWYIGVQTNFSVSTGKFGKYFKRYLPPDLYEMYLKTYSDSQYENFWAAVFTACELFHTAAVYVAEHQGFSYNQREEDAMITYLTGIKKEMYSSVNEYDRGDEIK